MGVKNEHYNELDNKVKEIKVIEIDSNRIVIRINGSLSPIFRYTLINYDTIYDIHNNGEISIKFQ